jgi:hypothetical protein
VHGLDGDRAAAAGEAHSLDDVRDRADARELVALARHQDHALLVADIDCQRDRHVREDDGVVNRDQQQGFHVRLHQAYVT